MTADFEPNVKDVMAARRRVGWKVWALASIMRWMGKEKEARKLEVGFDSFCVQNNSKTDRQLVFSTDALVALEAALDPTDAADYLLVWRPRTNRPERSRDLGGVAAKQHQGSRDTGKQPADAPGVLGRSERALAPVAGDVTWRRYLNTQMASVYRAVFGAEVQQRQLSAAGKAAAAAAGGTQQELSDDAYIIHDYIRIR